jgi:hypothetical protein
MDSGEGAMTRGPILGRDIARRQFVASAAKDTMNCREPRR